MTDHRTHPSAPDPATHPAEPMPDSARAAPIPFGEVVPGDPPVPITVWPVPPPEPGNTMSNGLGVRLVHNYTHPGELIVDLTDGPQLARAIIAAGRRSHLNQPGVVRNRTEPVALVATDWTAPNPNGTEFLAWCATLLRPLGCVAVVLDHDGPTEPSDVIAAAHQAGLGYLQHRRRRDRPHGRQPASARSSASRAHRRHHPHPFHPPGDTAMTHTTPSTTIDATATPREADRSLPVTSVWLTCQRPAREQRRGRYAPETASHPGKMLPDLAAHAIATYTSPGDLVVDPMCGSGTSLVEAVRAGRDAIGVDIEPRFTRIAEANLRLAALDGATAWGKVVTGDSRQLVQLLPRNRRGKAALVLTSPPYGRTTHGIVSTPKSGGVHKRHHVYGRPRGRQPRLRRLGRTVRRFRSNHGQQLPDAATRRHRRHHLPTGPPPPRRPHRPARPAFGDRRQRRVPGCRTVRRHARRRPRRPHRAPGLHVRAHGRPPRPR
jgi:hypothetical protein